MSGLSVDWVLVPTREHALRAYLPWRIHFASKEHTMGRAQESWHEPRSALLAAMPVTERRIQCAGISTSVLEGGAGTSVLLLHGPFGYAAHWLRVIPQLTKRYHVIAPDLPDHGASDAQGVILSIEHMLAWLDELIQKTCTSPVVLVAQTVSGALALRLVTSNGSNGAGIKRLVLVDTFGLSAFQPEPEFANALHAFAAGPSEHTHERMWEQCAFDLKKTRKRMGAYWEAFEAYNLDRARSPATIAAVNSLVQQFGSALPQERLARITVPTALIWGRHDRATNVKVAQAASARYGWPLTIIDDCADDPAVEQPEEFLEALRGFLEPGAHDP
jgi:pimeloyl-ACP methyl ester carboxylesterase